MASPDDHLDLTALYRRYGDMVYGRCLSMLRNEADAADACQEVFLKVHRHSESFRGSSSPSTWLYRIATNQCLNAMRTRRRHPEDLVERMEDENLPVGDGILDRLSERQLFTVLLDGWDERTQACVVHVFLDGMTQDEVGELLGISGAAVRKRLGRFREESRARLPTWVGWERAPSDFPSSSAAEAP